MKLQDLLECELYDITLVHAEEDVASATVVVLNNSTLTEAGRSSFADVLDATVTRIYNGIYGTQIQLDNVKASRIEEFGLMLAGYVPTNQYDEWVNELSEEMTLQQ